MPYEIREKNGKFHVVDKETNRVRGSYNDEDSAEDRLDDLEFKEYMRRSVQPREMTTEEKAKAYDELQSKEPPKDDKIPPKKDEKEKKEKKQRKSLYWDNLPDEDDEE